MSSCLLCPVHGAVARRRRQVPAPSLFLSFTYTRKGRRERCRWVLWLTSLSKRLLSLSLVCRCPICLQPAAAPATPAAPTPQVSRLSLLQLYVLTECRYTCKCFRSRVSQMLLYYSDRRPPHPWVCWTRASVCVWPRRPPTACTPCDDSIQTLSHRRRYAHPPSSALPKIQPLNEHAWECFFSNSLCWVPLCVDNRSTGGRVMNTATASRCRHSEKRPKGEERDQASKISGFPSHVLSRHFKP